MGEIRVPVCDASRSDALSPAEAAAFRAAGTWDSMVFKLAGAGAAIEWHRDADSGQCEERTADLQRRPIPRRERRLEPPVGDPGLEPLE